MTVRDIGSISEALLICGGAYSNRQALEALFAAAAARRIPASRIVHNGDVIAYCGEPDACARLLMDSGAHSIAGNVEEQLGANAADCACGFEEGSVCDTLARSWYELADRRVGPGLRAWMAGLPLHLTFRMAGLNVRVIHGGMGQINRFIYETDGEDVFAGELDAAGTDIVIAGHSGIPFTRIVGDRLWHNTGALGLPANDGTREGWYSVIAPDPAGSIVIEHHRLAFDADGAVQAMRRAGLPSDYADTLATGRYPENNSLPPRMQARTGRRLTFAGPVRFNPERAQGVLRASA